jgi:Ca-activated chloride channel family protein
MRSRPILLLCLSVWWGTDLPLAQRAEPPVLSLRADLVTLSVTVVDREGRYVTGLQRKDFAVYDSGERQDIRFFTNEDVPATVGLVVDSSGSMRGRREHVTAAGAAFAAMRHPLDEFFTVNFNEAVWLGLPAPIAFTEDVGLLRVALAAAPARGMTALYDAIDAGLRHLQRGKHDRKALIVVSDGGDNASVQTLDGVLDYARRVNAVIYAVALVDPDDREAKPRVLRTLARETGGRAVAPDEADDVMTAFSAIAQELKSGYSMSFVPPETLESGFRPVRVVAHAGNGRQLIVRTRAGYYAEPSGRSVK